MEDAAWAVGFDRVGSFRYLSADGHWQWSDAVSRMHGYEPGAVTPTTELLRSHCHPDDHAEPPVVDRVLGEHAAFAARHRIVDASGCERTVLVVSDRLVDEGGAVIGSAGFFIDVTNSFDADMQRSVTEVVAGVEERRAVINQAIGIIRLCYGVSADRAFEVLVWRSQETNVKLRVIAEHVVDELSEHPMGSGVREYVDHVLLTVHERIGRASGE